MDLLTYIEQALQQPVTTTQGRAHLVVAALRAAPDRLLAEARLFRMAEVEQEERVEGGEWVPSKSRAVGAWTDDDLYALLWED